MKNFIVNENDEGRRLNRFIEKVFLNLPESLIYKFIRKKNIKINSKRTNADYILKKNDIVSVYGLDKFFDNGNKFSYINNIKNFKLDVVFEDCNILVVNKKKKIKTHPNSNKKDSLTDFLIKYLIEKGEYIPEKENSFVPAFCGRLDTNTQGLLIAGKNIKALRALNELFREEKIEKTYSCVVEGIVKKKRDILIGYWSKNHDINKVTITPFERNNSKKVITKYTLVKQFKDRAELKVKIKNGKSHQIRAHLSSIGNPIFGDLKYGSGLKISTGQLLSCTEIEFLETGPFFLYLRQKKIILK